MLSTGNEEELRKHQELMLSQLNKAIESTKNVLWQRFLDLPEDPISTAYIPVSKFETSLDTTPRALKSSANGDCLYDIISFSDNGHPMID